MKKRNVSKTGTIKKDENGNIKITGWHSKAFIKLIVQDMAAQVAENLDMHENFKNKFHYSFWIDERIIRAPFISINRYRISFYNMKTIEENGSYKNVVTENLMTVQISGGEQSLGDNHTVIKVCKFENPKTVGYKTLEKAITFYITEIFDNIRKDIIDCPLDSEQEKFQYELKINYENLSNVLDNTDNSDEHYEFYNTYDSSFINPFNDRKLTVFQYLAGKIGGCINYMRNDKECDLVEMLLDGVNMNVLKIIPPSNVDYVNREYPIEKATMPYIAFRLVKDMKDGALYICMKYAIMEKDCILYESVLYSDKVDDRVLMISFPFLRFETMQDVINMVLFIHEEITKNPKYDPDMVEFNIRFFKKHEHGFIINPLETYKHWVDKMDKSISVLPDDTSSGTNMIRSMDECNEISRRLIKHLYIGKTKDVYNTLINNTSFGTLKWTMIDRVLNIPITMHIDRNDKKFGYEKCMATLYIIPQCMYDLTTDDIRIRFVHMMSTYGDFIQNRTFVSKVFIMEEAFSDGKLDVDYLMDVLDNCAVHVNSIFNNIYATIMHRFDIINIQDEPDAYDVYLSYDAKSTAIDDCIFRSSDLNYILNNAADVCPIIMRTIDLFLNDTHYSKHEQEILKHQLDLCQWFSESTCYTTTINFDTIKFDKFSLAFANALTNSISVCLFKQVVIDLIIKGKNNETHKTSINISLSDISIYYASRCMMITSNLLKTQSYIIPYNGETDKEIINAIATVMSGAISIPIISSGNAITNINIYANINEFPFDSEFMSLLNVIAEYTDNIRN